MIERNSYISELIDFRDKQLIKIITGIRRCGKSTLFDLYQDYLLETGIEPEQIISINLEDLEYSEIGDYKQLYKHITGKMVRGKMNYIFLDEIQLIPEFQKTVNSLFIKKNCDVYITGSNAFLLSGEFATLLSGRYVEIKMLPLSFKEYVSCFKDNNNLERLYVKYISESSFPYALELKKERDIRQYLDGIFNSIIIKDVIGRRKFPDIQMFQSVIRFMFDNIGNVTSMKRIADTMTSLGRKISINTVESYISALCESFILYKASRYDIKGCQYLQNGDKYYVADMGLRYFLLGNKNVDDGHILENVIYLELLRRGYQVFVGKYGKVEVDFVATKGEDTEFYQVAYTVKDEETLKRELAPLNSIKNHNPKFLLTMDIKPVTSHNGVKQINALDWLLETE